MTHIGLAKYTQITDPFSVREQLQHWLRLPDVLREQGFLLLLVSATLAEVAGNMVYVTLLERAYQLGQKAASVGGVLLVQLVLQALLGVWAGSLVDRLGKRQAAILATLAYATLAAGLVLGHLILVVYLLASLITLVRLVLVPARLALVPHLSRKEDLVEANTALAIVMAVGLFLGPAVGATLTLLTGGFHVALFVAGLGLLLSALPLLFIPAPKAGGRSVAQVSLWQEIRSGWQFVRKHSPVWAVLLCLVHLTLIIGAAMPLITPLAHHLGLGSEGTGVFFSAVGLGGLIGAPLAILLFKRLGASTALLLTGLLAPAGIFLTGLVDSLEGALAAILLSAVAAASLNIVVITILQRLTPPKNRGSVFGVQQTLLGLAWVASLAAVTGGTAMWPGQINIQALFLSVGGAGLLMALGCWLWHRRQLQLAVKTCKPRIQVLGAVCHAVCRSQLRVSGVTCRAICGSQGGCCD